MAIRFTLSTSSPIATRQRGDGKWQAYSRQSPDWLLADGASSEQEAIRKGFQTFGTRFRPSKRGLNKKEMVS
jgi:hypothetical protein